MDEPHALLRHCLAVMAYRTQKALREAPATFGTFQIAPGVRTPAEIVCHMTGMLGYAQSFFIGGTYRPQTPTTLAEELVRFHTVLEDLASHLKGGVPLQGTTPERLLQGPFADVMTHIGQLAMLRRLAGSPVPPENFLAADIDVANVGQAQALPVSPNPEWPEALIGHHMDSEMARLGQIYHLEVSVSVPGFPIKTYHGEITGKEANRENVESYWPLFASEWNLYPPELVQKAQLQHVILCENLAYSGQPRTSVPDLEHSLYIDVGHGRYSDLYTRKVIHHEFFHIIDWWDDRELYTDSIWIALNHPGAKYGPGGEFYQQDPSASLLTEDYPGFLTRYATAGLAEDKAEVFANMMVDLQAVEARAQKDPVVLAKMLRMKELLLRFCPQVDDQFWQRIRTLPRLRPVA
jgi:hypothetical protein